MRGSAPAGYGRAQRTRTENQRIECRIGVNLGDIIVEKNASGEIDMHGDGVIIAQSVAGPGRTWRRRDFRVVYDQLKRKVDAGFQYLGEHQVKNIAEPLRVYRVLTQAVPGSTINAVRKVGPTRKWPAFAGAGVLLALILGMVGWWQPWKPATEAASVARMVLPLPDKPSIVVLPFVNMSSDHGQDFFADGMTEDLIAELSKVSGLFVIARNTSFTYKGKPTKIAQVAEELGVRLRARRQRTARRRSGADQCPAHRRPQWWPRLGRSLRRLPCRCFRPARQSDEQHCRRACGETNSDATGGDRAKGNHRAGGLRSIPARVGTLPADVAEDYAKAIPFFEDAIKLDPGYYRAYAALALVYVTSSARQWTTSMGFHRSRLGSEHSVF